MSGRVNKKAVLEAGKKKMQEVVSDFQDRIDELKKVTVQEESGESASQSESRRDSDIELLDSMADQLDFANAELATLERIDPEIEHEKVDFGAVVVTDKKNLFVSTGIEDFEVQRHKLLGLSTEAPLYKNMAGSKVGDTVSFHGIAWKILDIY